MKTNQDSQPCHAFGDDDSRRAALKRLQEQPGQHGPVMQQPEELYLLHTFCGGSLSEGDFCGDLVWCSKCQAHE